MALPDKMCPTPQARITIAEGISTDPSSSFWQRTSGGFIVYDGVPYSIGQSIKQSRDPDTAIAMQLGSYSKRVVPVGNGAYRSDAVHFDGNATNLTINSLTAIDSGFLLIVGWLKMPSAFQIIFNIDTDNFGTNFTFFSSDSSIDAFMSNAAGNNYIAIAEPSGPVFTPGEWTSVIAYGETNRGTGLKLGQLVVNNQLIVNGPPTEHGSGDAFLVGLNGKSVAFPDTIDDTFPSLDAADWALYAVQTDLSVIDNLRLFVDANGKPVDPAVARAALGDPLILFSGDAATFATNQGTGGTFTLTGTLTNASTSPSD